MDLILVESVPGLGRPGDTVKVKAGYARNYLLPRRKAVLVSADVLRNIAKLKQRAEEEERALLSSMEELKAKLDGVRIELAARATEEGHLFGSVTEREIQAALEADGWPIPARSVRVEHHLKEAGASEATVHLYGGIEATITVEVVPVDVDGNRIEVVDESRPAGDADAGSAEGEAAAPASGDTAS